MHFEGASNYPHCIIQYLFSCVESTVTTFPYRERWYIFIPIVLKLRLNYVPVMESSTPPSEIQPSLPVRWKKLTT